jgi:MFS family permease
MSQGETAWISTAISLSSGSFLLLGGRLADLYGRKLVLVSSFALSAIWSIVAGFAKSKFMPASSLLIPDTYFSWLEVCKA